MCVLWFLFGCFIATLQCLIPFDTVDAALQLTFYMLLAVTFGAVWIFGARNIFNDQKNLLGCKPCFGLQTPCKFFMVSEEQSARETAQFKVGASKVVLEAAQTETGKTVWREVTKNASDI
jgi:hypothetical protein